jgi:hypothetical protein
MEKLIKPLNTLSYNEFLEISEGADGMTNLIEM